MIYQDQKIKAIGRLTIITIVLTSLLVISLIYPEPTRHLVQHFPLSRDGNNYGVWLAVLAIMTPICCMVNCILIFTSPEQEVHLVKWSKRWLKKPSPFEEIEFDTLDPDYRKAAWRYFFDRRKR